MMTLYKFLKSDSGAVTVDWVVLTGGLVGLGLATTAIVSAGVEDTSGDVRNTLETEIISASFASSVDYSSYPHMFFNDAWHDSAAIEYAAMSDADILSNYAAQYTIATGSVNNTVAMDHLAHLQNEMIARGMSVPEGNLSYNELYELNGGTVPT